MSSRHLTKVTRWCHSPAVQSAAILCHTDYASLFCEKNICLSLSSRYPAFRRRLYFSSYSHLQQQRPRLPYELSRRVKASWGPLLRRAHRVTGSWLLASAPADKQQTLSKCHRGSALPILQRKTVARTCFETGRAALMGRSASSTAFC